jgi:hypothetical protein
MTSLTPDGAEFDALYANVIEPALSPHEAERKRLIKQFWSAAAVGGIAGIAVAIVVGFLSQSEDTLDFGFMVAAGIAALAYLPLGRFEKRCKTQALTALAGALDMEYACDGFEPERVETLRSLGLLESWDDATYEDRFAGRLGAVSYWLYEARQTEGSGKNRRTTFSGQIIRVAFPKKFLGVTVINRERFWNRAPKGLERIRLESSAFEKIYEVYGDDQVEGRYLVHPVFMEKLTALATATHGRNLRCAFHEGDLLIVIEGSNLFEVIDVFKPVPNKKKTQEGVMQIQQLLGLIQAILTPPPRVYGSDPAPAS